MKRTGKRLAALTVAVCLFVSIGVASTSFAQILWVASVDPQMGVLPVYTEPSANSAMVGSLQRCARVILTGLEKDSFVEISQPIAGWTPANLLSEYSCSQGYTVPVEPAVIGSGPIGAVYGAWHGRHRHHFNHRRHGHHPGHHVRHNPGGRHPGGHNPGGQHFGHWYHLGGHHARPLARTTTEEQWETSVTLGSHKQSGKGGFGHFMLLSGYICSRAIADPAQAPLFSLTPFEQNGLHDCYVGNSVFREGGRLTP